MKSLSNAVIINGVSYTINATEAKKVAELLGITPSTTISAPKKESTPKAEPKKSEPKTSPKKPTLIVGSLEQSGAYVRTIKGAFISSKARYAIKMSATETFGATKLGKGNKVYDSLAKDDKYVQVYQFKSVEDADKFMAEQQSRMAK